MILLFTDFGYEGPYIGQMRSAAAAIAPETTVVDLMHDAPRFDPRAAAYLLAALKPHLPEQAIVCGVVDPGVGGEREPVVVEADGRCFVGPDNGLFEIIARRSAQVSWQRISDVPRSISASFHGRDLFAPTAARLAIGDPPELAALTGDRPGRGWPDELAEVIYVDGFGNAMTGWRADGVSKSTVLLVDKTKVRFARIFSEVPEGEAFWYANSLGLVEIAVNQGSAAEALGLVVGVRVRLDARR